MTATVSPLYLRTSRLTAADPYGIAPLRLALVERPPFTQPAPPKLAPCPARFHDALGDTGGAQLSLQFAELLKSGSASVTVLPPSQPAVACRNTDLPMLMP